MKDLPIAILSSNWKSTYHWFLDKHENSISEWLETHKMFIMRDGTKYIIVDNIIVARSREFRGMIEDPTYMDLRKEIELRIR